MRILVIEDDDETAAFLVKAFRETGHVADRAGDGPSGLARAENGGYDVLVIDRMLPGMEGLAIVEALRKSGDATPALILSARDSVPDRVAGLRAGGDDYLTKPFAFSELMARVEALVRRSDTAAPTTSLRVADLEMDLLAHRVSRDGRPIELQPREFRVLEYLMRHQGRVVTRTMLLEHVWEYNFDPQTNVIDVHISRLRQKIDRDFDTPLLHTVRGAGYRLGVDA